MKNTVTQQQIDEIIANSAIKTIKIGDSTVIVELITKEGQRFIDTHTFCKPEYYDEKVGVDCCIERIGYKILSLEEYCLKKELYNAKHTTAKERVKIELKELSDRAQKLSAFIDKCDDIIAKGENPPVSMPHLTLLSSQLKAMTTYKEILETRLKKWED